MYDWVRKLIKISILTHWAKESVIHIVQLFASGLDAGYKQLQLAFPSLPSNKVSNQGSLEKDLFHRAAKKRGGYQFDQNYDFFLWLTPLDSK